MIVRAIVLSPEWGDPNCTCYSMTAFLFPVRTELVVGGQIQGTEFLKYRNLNTNTCSSEPGVAGRKLETVWKCIWLFAAVLMVTCIVLFCCKTSGTSFELWLQNSDHTPSACVWVVPGTMWHGLWLWYE